MRYIYNIRHMGHNTYVGIRERKGGFIMKEVEIRNSEAGKLTIALSGDIDSGNADEFYAEVIAAYKDNPADVVFECGDLEFIDSTTLGTFVKILKTVKTDGRTMTLKNLQKKIKKLFLICSLNTVMEIE